MCGLIDGTLGRVDENTYLIQFTPWRSSPIWSVVSIAKLARLRTEDQHDTGLRAEVCTAVRRVVSGVSARTTSQGDAAPAGA